MSRSHIRALLWAQWRSSVHRAARYGSGSVLTGAAVLTLWYGCWAVLGWSLAMFAADPESLQELKSWLQYVLLGIFVYWQGAPLLTATSGAGLELSRVQVYPIPQRHLFSVQTLLRVSTSLEMMLLLASLTAGVVVNPALQRAWATAGFAAFGLLNVLCSAGIRDLSTRLFVRKGFRQWLVLAVVLLAAAPQSLLLTMGGDESWRKWVQSGFAVIWPWSAAARLATGSPDFIPATALVVWTTLAWWFARSQFAKVLRFDAAQAASGVNAGKSGWLIELISGTADRLLPKELGALTAREIRVLSRSPRFRLLLLMGFTFGLIIWRPMAMEQGQHSTIDRNFLTIVCVYAVTLLGEVAFWNSLGHDRSAAQSWFVLPIDFRQVMIAKNIAAGMFVSAEIAVVTAVCLAVRMPVTPRQVAEALGVTGLLAWFLLSAGNLMSVRYPKPMDPSQSWKASSGSGRHYLLLIYPVVSIPALLAYGARFAFDSNLAFWAVIVLDYVIALILYFVALDHSVELASIRREEIVSALSARESPVS